MHGAPTVEDAHLRLKVRFPIVKRAIEQTTNRKKVYHPHVEVSYAEELYESDGERRAIEQKNESS